MRPLVALVFCLLLLEACGGASSITTRQVFDQLQRAGLATNAQIMQPAETDSPIGRCGERLQFDIPGAPADARGVILICPKEPPLDLTAFGNAAVYRSAGGSVSVLVSGAPSIAPRIGEQVQQIKE